MIIKKPITAVRAGMAVHVEVGQEGWQIRRKGSGSGGGGGLCGKIHWSGDRDDPKGGKALGCCDTEELRSVRRRQRAQ